MFRQGATAHACFDYIGDAIMKTLFTTFAAATFLLAGSAAANPEFDNHDNFGTVLQDSVHAQSGGEYRPTGELVNVFDSSDAYGSVLYDLDRTSPAGLASQPSIGDDADDFGNILYDTGSVY